MKLHEIWATLAKSPRQLIFQFAQQRSMSSSPAWKWTELLHLHLYKTIEVHKHCDTDCEAQLNFLNWIPSCDAWWRNRSYTSMKFSRAEVLLTFRELTPSPSSECADVGAELVAEMSEKLHILTQLSAWENFIEFCCWKCFRT